MSRNLALLGAALLLLAASAGAQAPAPDPTAVVQKVQPAPTAEAFRSNPKFVEALQDAKQLARHHQMLFAMDAFKKASKLANGQCVECVSGFYTAAVDCGEYKAAAAAAAQWQALETTPHGKATAALKRGRALEWQGGEKPKPAQLEAAHAAFQEAVALDANNASALFADAMVLAKLGKMEDARKAFKQCVSCLPENDAARLRAEHFAENPELSTHKMAPPIVVTALDGSKFNLDAMGGRVVLIDFWATWCGPCNRELPHMKRIAKEFAGQPLVIISVSWDNDEEKWKDFVARNEMTWVQYRDADHKLADSFGINAIPHYFTIDSDGVLTSEMLGEDQDVEGKLKKLIKRAAQAQGRLQAAAAPPAPGK